MSSQTPKGKKLSPLQERVLAEIVEDGGKVRIFPPRWMNTGFATTDKPSRRHFRFATVNALLNAGKLRVVRRFPQNATEGPANGSAMECVVVEGD